MDEAHQNVNAADESKNHFVGKAGEKEYIYEFMVHLQFKSDTLVSGSEVVLGY